MKKEKLHPKQKKLLDILAKNIDDPLTIREMGEILDVSSTSVVAHHLNQLEKKGYLKKNPYNPRDYQILKDGPEKKLAYLNLYGLAYCGPNGSILDGNPIERIPVPTRLLSFPASEAFMVKAEGDSMAPRINAGDLVIAKANKNPDDNSIIVCVNNGEVLIKKIKKAEGGNRILISINQKYQPFLADKESFRIEGEIKTVISNKIR